MSSGSRILYQLLHFDRVALLSPQLLLTLIRFMPAVPALIFFYHSISYYADFLQAQSMELYDSGNVEVFDFIVVGGGSAGAVVANRLSKRNKVLLLELGGDPSTLSYIPLAAGALQRAPPTDLMYETMPQNNSANALRNNVVFWPRGTGIGGSSNLNYMIYQRGNPADYDNWAKITGNCDWAYESVLPVFKKLEDYHGAYPSDKFHGKGGPMHIEKVRQTYMEKYFLDAAIEKGFPIHDTNARQGQGFGEMDVTHHNGLRWSTYPGYIEPILKRRNLRIYRYARVTKIHLNRRRHAYAVTYFRHGMKKFVIASKEIIISTGAVDTPKLLLLSGIGPKSHLHDVGLKCRVNLEGVGRNLQDHLFTFVGPFIFNQTVDSVLAARDSTLDSIMRFTRNATGPLASISTISAVGHISTPNNAEKDWPNIQYLLTSFGTYPGFGKVFENVMNVKAKVLDEYFAAYNDRDTNFVLEVLTRPRSTGRIKLKGRDPWLKPHIQPNYFKEPQDITAMVEGAKFLVDLYENTKTFAKIGARLVPTPLPGCEDHTWRSDAYFECYVRAITLTLYHPVGTASMGKKLSQNSTSPPVVDSNLRVFKTTGLRVVDASIMPVIVNSNTNIPSIMIGEMGSSFIQAYWAQQYQICLGDWVSIVNRVNAHQCFVTRVP